MTQILSARLSEYFPQDTLWQRVTGLAILILLLIQVLSTPMTYACPA